MASRRRNVAFAQSVAPRMNPSDRTKLTMALRDHVCKIAADLRAKMRAPGEVRIRALQLHVDEQVAEDFDVWTDLLSRRAAVLWVLKSVYVRVLEDRGLLTPGRLLDHEAQQLFERLAPNLGETAFLRWIYRDLSSPNGGLPELFSPQPAEIAVPSDECSRALLAFWRHRDADTEVTWSFTEERFDGELMGDLYQELDPVVKDRFALCQTPSYVRDLILQETLEPAISEYGADAVRVCDPACGSGHFLLDAARRLVRATQEQHPDWPRRDTVEHVLGRLIGIDLNDYACALARARLVMMGLDLAGMTTLNEGAVFRPHVYWADGLEQIEREDPPVQLSLGDREANNRPRALLTRPEVRAALRPILRNGFHVIVGNPPYITERDPDRRRYHRERVGRSPRYVSAYRTYSLGVVFVERMVQLSIQGSTRIGVIIGNAFAKGKFGKAFVNTVISQIGLQKVIDSSGVRLSDHGTPTVLLIGRCGYHQSKDVFVVTARKAEPAGSAADGGQAWRSIVTANAQGTLSDEFVSTKVIDRTVFARHPWTMFGGAAHLYDEISSRFTHRLSDVIQVPIGRSIRTGDDEAFIADPDVFQRHGVSEALLTRRIISGDELRNWALLPGPSIIFPYDTTTWIALRESDPTLAKALRWLWPLRTILKNRATFDGTIGTSRAQWFEYQQHTASAYAPVATIAFAHVATHPHFVRLRDAPVANRSAPLIKLRSTDFDLVAGVIIAQLNSSIGALLLRQVMQPKGGSGVGRGVQNEEWMERYNFDGAKVEGFPLAVTSHAQLAAFAHSLDALAVERVHDSVSALISSEAASGAAKLRSALDGRRARDLERLFRMVGLQEELDWLCYRLYGIDEGSAPVRDPDQVPPLRPGLRPFEIALAKENTARRAALVHAHESADVPSAWFKRHGWEEHSSLEAVSVNERAIIANRLRRIEALDGLALAEQPAFKRRWFRPDYDSEEQQALREWLAAAVEAWASSRPPARGPFTIRQAAAALQSDPAIASVVQVLCGRPDYDLDSVLAEVIDGSAVPNCTYHLFTETGLLKRSAWERCWDAQRREDAGDTVTPEVPKKYARDDFVNDYCWGLRGKLDIHRERFIAFTEVPGRAGPDTLYGWAGWTAAQRLKTMLAVDEQLEDSGVPLADRVGLIDSAWRLLPDAGREDPTAATRLKAELQALVGLEGPSRELIEDWKSRFPPPTARATRTKRDAAVRDETDGDDQETDES